MHAVCRSTKPIPTLKDKQIARFWANVDKSGDCWIWKGHKIERGYGLVHVGKFGNILTHRISWHLAHGPIPSGMFVLHNCPGGDNPSCVRPDHLWLGTRIENNADRVKKGRSAVGESLSKLTEAQVLEAHARWANGEPQKNIAKDLGISRNNLSVLLCGHTWKHLGITPIIRDRSWRNSQISGEKSPRSKMTEANVRDAFAQHRAGRPKAHIARDLGVSNCTVGMALNGKTWRHLGLFSEGKLWEC